jgi:threonine/homoserine/homoserine lactone efflux protein
MTFIPIESCRRIAAGVSQAVGSILVALVLFPAELAAQGPPVQNGPMLPVAIWWLGAVVLGLVMAYAIFRNKSRTRAEKQRTEQATKNLYAKEERDRVRSGPGR